MTRFDAQGVRTVVVASMAILVIGATGSAMAQQPDEARGVASSTRAQAPERDSRELAAAAYDAGVAAFEEARYREAAGAFLRADELIPNDDALRNALLAAQRANQHLLVAAAAQRATSRDGADERLVTLARDALAEASLRLALIKLSCQPQPCTLTLDDEPIEAGDHYRLPGLYSAAAALPGGLAVTERLKLDAGATYTVKLEPARRHEAHTPKQSANVVLQPDATQPETLPRAVFYAGAAATAVLVGVTIWSGIDALNTADAARAEPTQERVDAANGRVLRTDLLLGGAVVLGAATTYVGLSWVDWSSEPVTSGGRAAAPTMVTYAGHF